MSVRYVHLVRHGEVYNPHDVIYADLPGYRLSDLGRRQARATARQLERVQPEAVVSSPTLRATQTATVIADASGLTMRVEPRLTEWQLLVRWSGMRWDALERLFPGELEAYLDSPATIPNTPETIDALGERVEGAINEWCRSLPNAQHIVFVGHQDPLHAGALTLTDEEPEDYHANKPNHGAVTTLTVDGLRWVRCRYWEPPI